MEFRLTFDGRLRASNIGKRSQTPARVEYRHRLRVAFGTQLKNLWKNTPGLDRAWPYSEFVTEQTSTTSIRLDDHSSRSLAQRHKVGNQGFVPLVTRQLDLLCGIDVLFLRREMPGDVLQSGDIDNRLKTLFDVLTKPDGNQGYDSRPHTDPIYVLLEDDRLVTKVSVETDVLHQEIEWKGDSETDVENDCRLVVTVRLRPRVTHPYNMSFL